MKKICSVLAIAIFAFSFSQTCVKITSDKAQLKKAYQGGQEKFDYDLANSLKITGGIFQVNGDFKLNFNVNENGNITDIKLLPELFDKSFEKEVKRDVLRMKKHFANNEKQNISVDLSFSRNVVDKSTQSVLTNLQTENRSR